MTPYGNVALAIACCAALGLVIPPPAGAAQSLGDVAKREAERRKATAPAGKVYTGDTLRPESSSRPTPPPAAAAPAVTDATPAAGAQADGVKGDAAPPATKPNEKAWRARIEGERDALRRAEIFAEALQSRINALSTDFVARDDPAQRNRIGSDREKALAELARVQQEIQQHTKNITAIQDEARREGVPAGWVR